MKRLILIAFLSPVLATAQDGDSTRQYHIRKHASIALSAPHHKMVWFTNQYLSVTMDFQLWLQENQNWFFDNTKDKELPNSGVQWTFKRRFIGNSIFKPAPLIIKVHGNSDSETIKNVDITGDWDAVSKLFVRYWGKPFTISEIYKVGEIAFLDSFGDRVTLYYIGPKKGRITIKPNTILTDKKIYDPMKIM
jgi:hypothetical protein